ncbi:hypothetical protein [Bradyrhizobium sp. JYMT SZCCT0180]|uniref:hypothetical protein n=1 Tax=Bradyrhizobium sp. JYMT SZCCT0180 TaxID=2807666 RepID=UPI001BA5DCF6|nr:hypothetical protein [Bradyrhizobium sp. JYMT SZCCT0180]MBR1213984.1 hypothetical protein [Bradyrhizobium sp. JYMT SZCCT0180]
MISRPSNTHSQLGDNEPNAVIGGHRKFRYKTMNGHTYAIGYVNGRTLMVRVD